MSDPYVGEIRLFAGTFAPANWAFCDGSLLSISQNTALFSLLGTTYGGNGTSTFALPDLRGRVPVHMGFGPGLSNYALGQQGGSENVTLTSQQLPTHTHTAKCATTNNLGTQSSPAGNYWSTDGGANTEAYNSASDNSAMAASVVGPTGGSQPHNNMQPFQVVNYIIALNGIYPPRS